MHAVSTLRRFPALWLTAVLLGPVANLAAQTPAPPDGTQEPAPATLQEEVARLNRTLERIADLLATQVDAQQIDLGMKRLEMLTARLERSERELRGLRSNRSSLETEQISLEEHRAQTELRLESVEAETAPEEARAIFRQIDRQLERIRDDLSETDRQIVELENQIATQRRDLEAWQDFVDRRLGGL